MNFLDPGEKNRIYLNSEIMEIMEQESNLISYSVYNVNDKQGQTYLSNPAQISKQAVDRVDRFIHA